MQLTHQSAFVAQLQWANNKMELDSTQNESKFSTSSLKMAFDCLKYPKLAVD